MINHISVLVLFYFSVLSSCVGDNIQSLFFTNMYFGMTTAQVSSVKQIYYYGAEEEDSNIERYYSKDPPKQTNVFNYYFFKSNSLCSMVMISSVWINSNLVVDAASLSATMNIVSNNMSFVENKTVYRPISNNSLSFTNYSVSIWAESNLVNRAAILSTGYEFDLIYFQSNSFDLNNYFLFSLPQF